MNEFERDEKGLRKGVNHIFNDDKSVNWRAMIPNHFLVFNKEYRKEIETRYNKSLESLDPSQVDDRYLLILLGGIKHVLHLRGFRAVKQHVDYVDQYKCVNTCTIDFLPNFETSGEPMSFSDTASASLDNTYGAFRLFIETISANRAFVRAVRNGLGINITGKDEFDERANKEYLRKAEKEVKEPTESWGNEAKHLLASRCAEEGISFVKFKDRAIEMSKSPDYKFTNDPATWDSFDVIEAIDAMYLIEKVNESARKKKKTDR